MSSNVLKQHPSQPTCSVRKHVQRLNGRRLLAFVLSGLILLLFAGLTLFPDRVAHAASLLRPEPQSCFTQPTATNCNQQDPIAQGCAADAQTLQIVPIMHQGSRAGQLEMRYSKHCHSYWGRSFSFSAGYTEVDMSAPFEENITGTWNGTFLAAYTDMVFEQRPALEGWVNFTATDHASATLT